MMSLRNILCSTKLWRISAVENFNWWLEVINAAQLDTRKEGVDSFLFAQKSFQFLFM